jgi:hypothetical protein
MTIDIGDGRYGVNAGQLSRNGSSAQRTFDFTIIATFAAVSLLVLIGVAAMLPLSDDLSAPPLW